MQKFHPRACLVSPNPRRCEECDEECGPAYSDGSRDCPRLPLTCRVSSVSVLASSRPGPSTCTTRSRAVLVSASPVPVPDVATLSPPCRRVACVDHVGRAPVLGPNTVSQPPAAGVDRTWSWCRPKKEDWLKKKDRYQRRPGCGRKKTRHCWVSSSSGPQRCRSARVGELLLRAQPWHLVPHHTVTTATVSSPLLLALRSPDGRGWVMLGSPNIAARVSRPTLRLTPLLAGCGRRLVEEEGSSSKKTWLRKTVGCGGRRAPAPGPAATFWWRLSPGHPSPEVVTMSSPPAAMGVRAQHSHYRARDSKPIGEFGTFLTVQYFYPLSIAGLAWDEPEPSLESRHHHDAPCRHLSLSWAARGGQQTDCKSAFFRVVFLRVLRFPPIIGFFKILIFNLKWQR